MEFYLIVNCEGIVQIGRFEIKLKNLKKVDYKCGGYYEE